MSDYLSSSDLAFDCLVDTKRLSTFANEIRMSTRKGQVAADIGTGTGILALIAYEAGAKHVYAVEADEGLCTHLQSTFHEKKLDSSFTLIKGDARKIALPEKIDLMICELVATGLIDELQVPVLNHLRQFMKPSTIVIPSKICSYIDIVKNNNSFLGHKLPIIRYEYPEEKRFDSISFSEKYLYNSVNFKEENEEKISCEVSLPISKNGIVNGLRISNTTEFPSGKMLSDTPAYCIPLILPIRDCKVKKGDKIKVKFSYKMGGGMKTFRYNAWSPAGKSLIY